MGSQRGSSSSARLSATSKPSSSQRCSSSRNKNTRFSSVSGDHSKSRTPSRYMHAVTRMPPRLEPLISQCIFVSKRWGRLSSWAMRLASFTSGMMNMSCSSSRCMACSWYLWSSSSAAAFFAAASSSRRRRWASASAFFCLSSNSRCKRSNSSACFLCSSAAFRSSAAAACACSSNHSCRRFSICCLNSSSRFFRSSPASLCACSLATCASFTLRSSSSANARLAFNSSSDAPPISPCASASSLRAISKLTFPSFSRSAALPKAGSTKTK
mmetsp:Transcript_39365/g.113966  ORF Transcript_39365/g.113966 Transcript_39365/m.113966 type:complete len:270 (-) Transcript_39365:64-873(-)